MGTPTKPQSLRKITTTGQLRQFLSEMLVQIESGQLEADDARNITKMAAQINESFYSEIKIAKIRLEIGQGSSDLGLLPINGEP